MTTTWQDIRRIADDVRVQIHLAGMDTRDRWHALEHRLAELENRIGATGAALDETLTHELAEVHEALLQVRDAIYGRAREDFVTGW